MEFFTHAVKLLKMCETTKELDSVFADFQKHYNGLGCEFPGCYQIVKKSYESERSFYDLCEKSRKAQREAWNTKEVNTAEVLSNIEQIVKDHI